MDYLVKIRSVQTPLNSQFSIGANSQMRHFIVDGIKYEKMGDDHYYAQGNYSDSYAKNPQR